VPGFWGAAEVGVRVGLGARVDLGVATGVTAAAVGTSSSYSTPGERSDFGAGVVTTGIATTVGEGEGKAIEVAARGVAGGTVGSGGT
jgi:hypothetical protein